MPTSSFQNRSTVGMLTRSSGECGPSICGPIASMSRWPLTLVPMTAVSSPAWIAGDDGRLAEEPLVDRPRDGEHGESRSGRQPL